MRLIAALSLLFVFADGPARPEQAISYFTNIRDVHVAQPDRQNYFIVDEELWTHSRPDLGDLRLYDVNTPVQYYLAEQRARVSSDEVEAKILNLGTVSGQTEFDIDAEGLPEYDRVRLRLDAHDFVATASVAGGNAPSKATEVQLAPSTLYDFTKEQLGSNSLLKLPPSSFRYLHVKLSSPIRPPNVRGATIYNLHEQQALWTTTGTCAAPTQKRHVTLISCTVSKSFPVERIRLQIPPDQVNFHRAVTVEDGKGAPIFSGEIGRVRITRGGVLITNENVSVKIMVGSDRYTLTIDNGDNPPIMGITAEPQAVERRVYFDPQGKTALRLYYGDERLSAPEYDYARFFHLDASPAQAQLASGSHNPHYAGRPDERPWSDRHAVILWAAMLFAVIVLAALALQGLRTQKAQ